MALYGDFVSMGIYQFSRASYRQHAAALTVTRAGIGDACVNIITEQFCALTSGRNMQTLRRRKFLFVNRKCLHMTTQKIHFRKVTFV